MFGLGWVGTTITAVVVLLLAAHPRLAPYRRRPPLRIAAIALLIVVQVTANNSIGADYKRVSAGTDVVRLIPIIQFEPGLLATSWLPDQISMGALDLLAIALAFAISLRQLTPVSYTHLTLPTIYSV